jgi:class 3 adenylate cyclase
MAGVGQRKTITVLFSDLVESTALAERLDPEALTELLSGYFGAMRAIIERHGGTVEKYIGDAVVGMFGVPTAHEDDAVRAVRAALEMQDALGAMNEQVKNSHSTRLAARIGINSGEVAVAAANLGDQLATVALGHAINMAARLEQAAGAGSYLQGRARLAMADGDVSLAMELAREAVDTLAGVDAIQNEAKARELLGDLLAQAGDAAGSAAEVRRARDLYAAKGYFPGERRVAEKITS